MTKWNAAEVQKELLQALATRLRKHGYDGPKEQSFHRRIEGGRTFFHVAFVRHAADLDVTADVAIRVDALEDLLSAQDPPRAKRRGRHTASVGAELGNIAGSGQKRWTIRDREEIPRIADAIVKEFESLGLPFLHEYTSLENLLAMLSRNGPTAWLLSPIPLQRCKSAVGLAHLLDKPALVEELIQRLEEALRSKGDWGLQPFVQFADWIRAERARPRSS